MFPLIQPSGRIGRQKREPLGDGLHTLRIPHRNEECGDRPVTIRVADSDGQRSTANMLINRKYDQRGYGNNHKVPTLLNCVTFTATSEDNLIGTLSLTVDSAAGLAADKTFKEELDEARKEKGVRICELTRFAFDTSEPSMKLLASLFHIIFIYGTCKFGGTDLYIEVNPRHRRFYEAMLGFKRVGQLRTNEAVGAPSQLLWLRAVDIRRKIDEHAGKPIENIRSLYPYFFSKKEELGIYGRLFESDPAALPSPYSDLSHLDGVIAGTSEKAGMQPWH